MLPAHHQLGLVSGAGISSSSTVPSAISFNLSPSKYLSGQTGLEQSRASLELKGDVGAVSDFKQSGETEKSVSVAIPVSVAPVDVNTFSGCVSAASALTGSVPNFPPVATSNTSAHTEQTSRVSNIPATSVPSRRARKKASHKPALTHAGPVACISSLETIPEDVAVSKFPLRLSGADQESQVGLTSASAGEVPMGPSHEDATVIVQNSLVDVGFANVLMNACQETSDGVITTSSE